MNGEGPLFVQSKYRAAAEARVAELAGDDWRADVCLYGGDLTSSRA